MKAKRAFGQGVDAVVCGGGLAGLEAALVLAERSADVLVVDPSPGDEGPGRGVRHTSSRPPHYAAGTPVGVGLGGRSLLWHGVALRLEDWALDDPRWPVGVRSALRRPGGLYDEAVRDLESWSGTALDAPRSDGDLPLCELLRAAGCDAARPVPRAVRGGFDAEERPYTPARDWQARHGDATSYDSEVIEVLPQQRTGWRVRVADAAGLQQQVDCRAVVLAAGTMENTRLAAQLLGLHELSGLHDHLVQGVVCVLPASRLALLPRRDGFAMVSGDAGSRGNLFVRTRALPDPDLVLLDAWVMSEQLSSPSNVVRLRPSGGAPWRVEVAAAAAAEDQQALACGANWLQQVVGHLLPSGQPPLRLGGARLAEPRPFAVAREQALRGPVGQPHQYWWPLGTVDHEGGTLPLGGILDDVGQVRGHPGVYVVGPATFPRAGAANPSLTTIALARHTAYAVAAQL